MGQRFQGFVKTQTRAGTETIGCHHQWLYGATAVQQLRNILEFNFKARENYKLGNKEGYLDSQDVKSIVLNLASTNAKEGYYHNVLDLKSETESWPNSLDPDCQDNNDGQFFIDFTVKGKPKVGFTHPFSRDTYEDDGEEVVGFDKWQIMGAREYFHLYYSQKEIDEATETNNKGDIAFFNKALRNIKWIENHIKLLTQEELFTLYPTLKED